MKFSEIHSLLLKLRFVIFGVSLICWHTSFADALVPLDIWLKDNPKFLSNVGETYYFTNRCSALSLVLSNVGDQLPQDREVKQMTNQFYEMALTYHHVTEVLSKLKLIDEEKKFVEIYNLTVTQNWKKSGDVFKEPIGDDLELCRTHLPYFKKFVASFPKN